MKWIKLFDKKAETSKMNLKRKTETNSMLSTRDVIEKKNRKSYSMQIGTKRLGVTILVSDKVRV